MSEAEEDVYGTLRPGRVQAGKPAVVRQVPPPKPNPQPDDSQAPPPGALPEPPPPRRRPEARPAQPGRMIRPTPPPPAAPVKAEAPASPPKPTPPRPVVQAPAVTAEPEPSLAQALLDRPAAEVCRGLRLGDEAAKLLEETSGLLPFLYRLLKENLFVDAVRVLARALPQRDGIRWAADCVRNLAGSNSPEATAALRAVDAWLADPSEANRQAAAMTVATAGYGTAAGSAALAVDLTGRSRSTFAQAVANAVILAVVTADAEQASARFLQFLKDGLAALASG